MASTADSQDTVTHTPCEAASSSYQDESLMCSVLNVVIDHSMEDPTPMEPEEYHAGNNNKKTVKVPVVRIFGPLLRDARRGPLQSACLYVHGAFPYLLARPVVAGPDGSLRRVSPSDGQVNWDDPASVERIVRSLKTILEDAIQSLDMERQQQQQHKEQRSSNHPPLPVIRRITVVQGRGFYTYCPGPPAPFLRVEYYDPKLRWKVKMMLERGLQVPLSYYPDAQQYDRSDEELDVLRFHCYEAHIPYTMQFFKDWNLAGMSYLHVKRGRIRPSLRETCFVKYRSKPFDKERDAPAVFLRSNTPREYLWPGPSKSEEHAEDCSEYFKPPAKGTVADVEIDCTVHDLQNVETVLKTLPSDLEERDRIQWRAVPSLQEIWRQERRRMSKLLRPEQDFLSHLPLSQKDQVPFTLNVKQGAERSGNRLAEKGMRSLVKLTYGLEEDFNRSLRQILERHKQAIEQADQMLLYPPVTPARRAREHDLSLTPNMDEAIEALASLAEASATTTPKTPSLGDAVKALESLQECTSEATLGIETSLRMETPKSTAAREEDIDMEDVRPWSQSQTSMGGGLSYPSSQEMHQDSEVLTVLDAAELSQRIDRGDTIFQDAAAGRDDLDDYIDAETLLPYEHLDFADNRCRVQFTVDTDPPGTIRICGNLYAGCRRENHVEQGEAKRAAPGYYKTVTTGTFVDGILDTSHAEHDYDEEDNERFEQALSMLATQIRRTDAASSPDMTPAIPARRSQLFKQAQRQNREYSQELEMVLESDGSSDDSEEVEHSSDDVAAQEEGKTSAPSTDGDRGAVLPSGSQKRIYPPTSYPAWITPAVLPPTRKAFSTLAGGSLHPKSSGSSATPSWLGHAAKYMQSRAPADIWVQGRKDYYVQPVHLPPTRRKVESWCKKRWRDSTGERAKRRKNDNDTSNLPRLEIDGNSRKIVVAVQGTSSAVEQSQPNLSSQHVEEVEWKSSQPWQLSMSQLSHNDELRTETKEVSDSLNQPMEGGSACKADNDMEDSRKGGSGSDTQRDILTPDDALDGIGAQGGRIHVQGGGTLKAKTRATQVEPSVQHQDHGEGEGADDSYEFLPTPISFMSIEVHVQCRTGASRLDSKKISMAPDSNKDKIFAVVYVYGVDPGGGESLKVLERCCLFVRFEQEQDDRQLLAKAIESSMPRSNLGVTAPLHVECFDGEKRLLLRLSSLVTAKDPDMLLSWDTQGAGLGYIIERGVALGVESKPVGHTEGMDGASSDKPTLDMVRLLGRTPFSGPASSFVVKALIEKQDVPALMAAPGNSEERKWKGSGLGSDWDDTVGAGAAASSIAGRLIFAGWKIVAEEVKHPNYSYLPAVAAAVLNKRIPYHDDLLLTRWYSSGTERWRVLHHRLTQAMATMLLFDALDIIGRAGEAARLSGVEFSQSFPGIRGSQYKVEGVLLRALQSLRSDERGSKEGYKKSQTPSKATPAKSQSSGTSGLTEPLKSMTQSPWKLRRGIDETLSNLEGRHYFFYSPSLDDTNRQEALEVQALTLEPESGHYKEPVVVCDFTALYPSLVIAYNLCYSTCAGKLEYHSTRSEMRMEGRTSGRLGPFAYPERRTATVLNHHFKSLCEQNAPNENRRENRGYIAPTGTIYVGEDVLKGVLPQVLDEMLTTRAMLKRAAKEYKKHVKDLSPAILRQLEARQLALKYVANVTYGYTSATFSGRCAMPLLADTIVECGRKTLRKAIDLANRLGRGNRWRGAKVIYGDTDSLFVKLPGRSYQEAFDFGEELCRAVTADNPPPVQLKLEKVYLGSIMQTMKRYCGMKFESKSQKKPTFEAKGLETVRRDQCGLTQKILRNALITLFRDGIDGVRDYLYRQWSMIEAGHIPVADFILTGRVRSKYRGGKEGPVQAVLAKRIGEADPGRIIRHKERLPYVIVATPGVTFRLKDCVLTPTELLERWDAYTIHTAYYIERHVNASLKRCLGLAPHFVDVSAWYQACPKPRRRIHFWPVRSRGRAMITNYFGSDVCSLCHRKCQASGRAFVVVCSDCRKDEINSTQLALSHLSKVQMAAKNLAKECSACNGCFEDEDTFASLVEPDDSESRKLRTMDLINGGPGGECLRLPLANCVCIDCPNTYKRHHIKEQLIEATATCEVLDLFSTF